MIIALIDEVIIGAVAEVLALLESLHLFVVLSLEAELLLDEVAGEGENNDACDLNAEVSPGAEAIIGEKSDGSSDHVGTEEGGGVHNELVTVVVGVPAEDGSTEDLEDVLHVDGDSEHSEESPGN